jgi:two-component system, chemotaxis family, protein-glutamate methylesterase/glutaminase
MGKIRVVIADDSSLARGLLRDFLEGEDDMEVVGEAMNGRQAVELARELKPSIITMDLEMPHMNGLEAIEEIMCSKAVPILVVSSVADAANALDAVGRGALEVVSKPDYSPEKAAEFVAKVRLLAGVSVITRMRPRKAPVLPELPATPVNLEPVATRLALSPTGISTTVYPRVFAIASSTGGPQALAQILPALPADFPCPVVIAQHISDGFAAGMAEWLGRLCKLPVRMVAEGELLQAGVIHISPSERHFSITPTRRVALLERGPLDVYRPSCDVLLGAVAEVFGHQAIGIILTGMGSDGAKGMARIHERGGMTLGQDETSSVIFGMNRVAIESGVVSRVLRVDEIAAEMVRLANPFDFGRTA